MTVCVNLINIPFSKLILVTVEKVGVTNDMNDVLFQVSLVSHGSEPACILHKTSMAETEAAKWNSSLSLL